MYVKLQSRNAQAWAAESKDSFLHIVHILLKFQLSSSPTSTYAQLIPEMPILPI